MESPHRVLLVRNGPQTTHSNKALEALGKALWVKAAVVPQEPIGAHTRSLSTGPDP